MDGASTSGIRENQSTSDDEILLKFDGNEDEESVLERLKEFAYYLVEHFEIYLNSCLALLEERSSAKSNSVHAKASSKTLSAMSVSVGPFNVGSLIGGAVSKAELKILEIFDKKNSKKLAHLIYYYSNNKENIRTLLIKSAVDIFYSFEYQFRKLTCNAGPKKAMQKLAMDASDRIFNYFLEMEQIKEITKIDITKGVIFGDSKRNKLLVRDGRTVFIDGNTWKTDKMFKDTGLIIDEQAFYKNYETKKYGYRRLLLWENKESVRANWQAERDFELPKYYLTSFNEDLFKTIRDYIMSQNPNEEAKLERENYNKDAVKDRKVKHEEVLTTIANKSKELLDDAKHHYKIINDNHNETKKLLKDIHDKQDREEAMHQEISNKLEEIHETATDNKFKELLDDVKHQYEIIKYNHNESKELLKEIADKQDMEGVMHNEVINKLEEIHKAASSAQINTDVIKDIVVRQTKDALKDYTEEKRRNGPVAKIVNAVENLRNDDRVTNVKEAFQRDLETLRENNPVQTLRAGINATLTRTNELNDDRVTNVREAFQRDLEKLRDNNHVQTLRAGISTTLTRTNKLTASFRRKKH